MEQRKNRLYFNESELAENQLWSPIFINQQSVRVIGDIVAKGCAEIAHMRSESDVLDHQAQIDIMRLELVQSRRNQVGRYIAGQLSENDIISDFSTRLASL